MDDDLISKKQLLDLTGISYGQLYRWKRKQLIPEDWFIRKSTFTGQETFFPKEKILSRIDNIVNMKDGLSLDEMADKLSDKASFEKVSVTTKEIIERNIVSTTTLRKFGESIDDESKYTVDQLVHLFAVDRLLSAGEMSMEEAELLFRTLEEKVSRLESGSWELFFVRKMGVSSFILARAPAELWFDEGVRLVSKMAYADLIEQLKGKLAYKLVE
ncbi:YhbD family protein [Paenibacillus sp. FSL R10-2734]|uniref:YhbD family protein n=1 Tax=Paenibacillus sp. FSL R10-2734 TaxID=2954691 RepID=UPI0030D9409B